MFGGKLGKDEYTFKNLILEKPFRKDQQFLFVIPVS